MAFPNIIVSTEANNTLVITNKESVAIYIGIQIYNITTSTFTDYIDNSGTDWNTTIPSVEVEANDLDFTVILGLDGLYKLRLKDLSTDSVKEALFIMSSNIDACEKVKLQDILCKKASDCKTNDCKEIAEDLKFYALKDTLTYFYKSLVDGQGVAVPTLSLTNAECVDIATTINTLASICGCVNQEAGGNFIIDESCGCIKYNYTI